MRTSTLCLAIFTHATHAHYNWPWLYVNGTQPGFWQYVRDVAGGYEPNESDLGYMKTIPQYDVTSTNFTCGRLAFDSAKKTETADVVAGTEVSFRVNQGWLVYNPSALYSGLNHPGPAQAYLAKPPEGVALEEFSGVDGDWFKIASLGAASDSDWVMGDYDNRLANITIPVKTPPGKYLLRFEQYWLDNRDNRTQFFLNCAHINVMGPGGGSLAGYPYAKFPGAYDQKDPGNLGAKGLEGQHVYPRYGLSKWIAPGPAVWTG